MSEQNPFKEVDKNSGFSLSLPEIDGRPMIEKNGEAIMRAGIEGQGPDVLIFDLPDLEILVGNERLKQKHWPAKTTFYVLPDKKRLGVVFGEIIEVLEMSPDEPNLAQLFEAIQKRNEAAGFLPPDTFKKRQTTLKTQSPFPTKLRQSTFIEARALSHAISDAPNGANYREVEGENAVLHSIKKVPLQTRFQPSIELWSWWGIKPTKEAVMDALKKLNFETNVTFQVTLACLLQTEHTRRTFKLDEIIKLIGRDTDARRSKDTRQELRREAWGNILALASMPVVGARNGLWREPNSTGEKRPLMPKESLISRDPLLVITGIVSTNNSQEPPENFTLTAGEWLMPHIGNREILSDLGDVLKLAQIPRGKPSGAWAMCIGLALQQQWREEATKAEKKFVSRGKTEGPKIEVLRFRPFTRRELLTEFFKCDDENSPNTILGDPKGRRARAEEYWRTAITELKTLGLIGDYQELKTLKQMGTTDMNAAWLDQPLSIRPSGEILKDALEIHNDALEARKRGRVSGKKSLKI